MDWRRLFSRRSARLTSELRARIRASFDLAAGDVNFQHVKAVADCGGGDEMTRVNAAVVSATEADAKDGAVAVETELGGGWNGDGVADEIGMYTPEIVSLPFLVGFPFV